MAKNSIFFELFGPPCGNPLANLYGLMPECAQVCALHTPPHLTKLRKTETADGWVAIGVSAKLVLRHSLFGSPCRTPWAMGPNTCDSWIGERQSFFHYAAYMPLFLIVSEIDGCKVSKWWKIRNFFELFGPPCRNALADLDNSTPECAQVCALHIEPHLATLRKIKMVAVLCTNETTPNFWVFNSPSPAPRGRWTHRGRGHVGRVQTLSLQK